MIEDSGFWSRKNRETVRQRRALLREFIGAIDEKETREFLSSFMRRDVSKTDSRDNTMRAYRSDQERYKYACAQAGIDYLQPTREFWLHYFTTFASERQANGLPRRASTIVRASYGIASLFTEADLPSPTRTMLHRSLLKAICRADERETRKARPLRRDEACKLLNPVDEGLVDIRDRAIAAFGSQRALRAASIVSLRIEDLAFSTKGLAYRLRSEKTATGSEPIIRPAPHESGHYNCVPCLVRLWVDILELLNIREGPLFRRIDRWGHISAKRLTTKSVTFLLRKGLRKAEVAEANSFSSHSYRHGFVRRAVEADWNIEDIMLVTGHRSRRGLAAYLQGIDPWYFGARSLPITSEHLFSSLDPGWLHPIK